MAKVLNISEATTIALHAMTLLASDPEQKMPAKEVAARLKVSEAHLVKVLQRLAKAGMIKAERGPKGGFQLDRDPDDITLLEIYEAIEGPLVPVTCLLGSNLCGANGCILGNLLEDVHRQVKDYLRNARLSGLADVFKKTA